MNNHLIVLAVFAIGVVALLACKTASSYYDSGVSHLDEGAYDEAIDAFSMAIESDPEYIDAYVGRGRAYFKHRSTDNAIADFDRALSLDPDNNGAYRYRGLTYFGQAGPPSTPIQQKQRYLAQSVADLERALELTPSNATEATYIRNELKDSKEFLAMIQIPNLAGVWYGINEETISVGIDGNLQIICRDGHPIARLRADIRRGSAWVEAGMQSRHGWILGGPDYYDATIEEADAKGQWIRIHDSAKFIDRLSYYSLNPGESHPQGTILVAISSSTGESAAGNISITGAAEAYKHLSCVPPE